MPPNDVEGQPLDVVEVHHDVRDVAGEAHPRPLAETSMLSDALLPLKSSRSSPPWPSTMSLPSPGSHWKRVVAAAQERRVQALVAVDEVVAAAAQEQVGAVAAAQRVVAGAAVDRQRGQRREVADGRDRVRAVEAEQHEALDRGGVDPRGSERSDVLPRVPFANDGDRVVAAVPL